MTDFTPGPWKISLAPRPSSGEYDWCVGGVINGEMHIIAECFARVDTSVYPDDEAKANMSLIAAAPDMLAALELAYEFIAD